MKGHTAVAWCFHQPQKNEFSIRVRKGTESVQGAYRFATSSGRLEDVAKKPREVPKKQQQKRYNPVAVCEAVPDLLRCGTLLDEEELF